MFMGNFFCWDFSRGIKRRDSIFVVVRWGETCQGWSIFPQSRTKITFPDPYFTEHKFSYRILCHILFQLHALLWQDHVLLYQRPWYLTWTQSPLRSMFYGFFFFCFEWVTVELVPNRNLFYTLRGIDIYFSNHLFYYYWVKSQ